MTATTPLDIIDQFIDARSRGDIEAAARFYETDAAIVVQPGVVASGAEAIRGALERFASLRPVFQRLSHGVTQAGDLALYCSHWTLAGTTPTGEALQLEGRSADVLRRQADGQWRIVVDNPWSAGGPG